MDKKKSFGTAIESFFAGKGFYIVLFLCVAIIGISAWTMLSVDTEDSPLTDPMSLSEPVLPAESVFDGSEVSTIPEEVEEAMPVMEIEPEEPVQAVSAPAPAAVQPAPETAPTYFVPPVAGEVENGYAMESLQYNRTMQDWRTHDGIDIAAELGSQVKAVADGKVERVYADDAMGTTVVLLHPGGLRSIYSNLAESPTVKEGDAVATGSVIGSVGSTALSETGEVNHLHFAMSLQGKSVDPGDYLP